MPTNLRPLGLSLDSQSRPDELDYVFLKQAAVLDSYFGELCLDVTGSDSKSIVYSAIPQQQIGNCKFISGPSYSRRSALARVWSWMKYCISAAIFVFTLRGDPLLFVVAQPPMLPLIGYLQSRLLRRNYVVWAEDIFPDVLVRRGLAKSNSLLTRGWAAFNRLVLRRADVIFTLGPAMRDVLGQYVDSSRIEVVPTWVDANVFRPIPRRENPFVQEHGLADKFTVMYSGNMGATHDLSSLLSAARLLRDTAVIRFFFIGGGEQWSTVRDSVAEQQDPNIVVLPWVAREVLPNSLAAADVSVVSLERGMEGISMPSKTYNAMAAGSAILAICTAGSDPELLISKYHCGVIVEPGEPELLASVIRDLAADEQRVQQMKHNARAAAAGDFSRQQNAEQLRAILKQVRSRRSS